MDLQVRVSREDVLQVTVSEAMESGTWAQTHPEFTLGASGQRVPVLLSSPGLWVGWDFAP